VLAASARAAGQGADGLEHVEALRADGVTELLVDQDGRDALSLGPGLMRLAEGVDIDAHHGLGPLLADLAD